MAATALPALVTSLRRILPSTLPKSCSYILPASTLTALGHPTLVGPLFTHATAALPAAAARPVSLQLRDTLLKEWTLVGIPLVITAVASLAAAEKAAGHHFPNELSPRYGGDGSLAPNAALARRGEAFMKRLYKGNLEPIFSTWGSHEADFTWVEKSAIYGLFLSDHEVLSEIETELVILSSIMAQNLKGPTLWHLRGLRRLGVSKEDVEGVVRAVEECARWTGSGEKEWVSWVAEVDNEV
ncbi:hypothetical protein FB451DRAFT_692827 [Mycena latifolia]|nr:hypothetical protein FB451DRAFT_692827 [Mycena latifolia]